MLILFTSIYILKPIKRTIPNITFIIVRKLKIIDIELRLVSFLSACTVNQISRIVLLGIKHWLQLISIEGSSIDYNWFQLRDQALIKIDFNWGIKHWLQLISIEGSSIDSNWFQLRDQALIPIDFNWGIKYGFQLISIVGSSMDSNWF